MPEETIPRPQLLHPPDKLDELLAKFKPIYRYKLPEWQQCLDSVAQDLGHVLAQERVQHIPIAARVKTWKSITVTAARRQRDKIDDKEVRDKMGDRVGHFEEKHLGYGGGTSGSAHFQTPGELERIFHDMLGARITLYFPSDKKKVLELLNLAGYEEAKAAKRMGGLNDSKRLRKLLKESLTEPGDKSKDHLDLDGREKRFSGYDALHLVVKVPKRLQPRDLGDAAKIWDATSLEIQVGTVIMHAWSEVEHDITYKTRDGGVTDGEKGLLDILNGLAIASEIGLRSFHSTTAELPFVTALKELRSWLHQLYIQNNESTPAAWVDLEFVWEVLIKSKNNKRDLFMPIAKSAREMLTALEGRHGRKLDQLLPYVILDRLCAEEDGSMLDSGSEGGVVKAHQLAVQLVNSLNLAQRMRLRPEEAGAQYQSHLLRRHYDDVLASDASLTANISMLDVFDMLHPHCRRYKPGCEAPLALYCETLLNSAPSIDDIRKTLDAESRNLSEQGLLDKAEDLLTIRVLTRLARCHFTARPIIAGSDELGQARVSETITISGALVFGPALQFRNLARDAEFDRFVEEEGLRSDLPTLSTDLRRFLDKYTRHLIPVDEPHDQEIGMWQVDTRDRPPKVELNQCWEIMGKTDFPKPFETIATKEDADGLADWPVGFKVTAGLFRRLRLKYSDGGPEPLEQERWWQLLNPRNLPPDPAFGKVPPPRSTRGQGSVVRLLIDKDTYARLVDDKERTILLETVSGRRKSAARLLLYSDSTDDVS